jgi:hypothetical protein
MRWLQKAYEDRSEKFAYIGVDPRLDTLHSDPRWAGVLRNAGLKEFVRRLVRAAPYYKFRLMPKSPNAAFGPAIVRPGVGRARFSVVFEDFPWGRLRRCHYLPKGLPN